MAGFTLSMSIATSSSFSLLSSFFALFHALVKGVAVRLLAVVASIILVVCLLLFKAIFLHQLSQHLVGDALLVRLVVDGHQRDVSAVGGHENGVGDDPCAAALALALRGDGEAHLAQLLAELRAHERILAQFLEESLVVVSHRRVALGELFQLLGEVGEASMLQFIEQVLRFYALQLALLHLPELAEGMVDLVERLLLGLCLLRSIERPDEVDGLAEHHFAVEHRTYLAEQFRT